MADRKIFDLSIGVMIGVFVLSILWYISIDMDSSVSNYGISNHLGNAYFNASSTDSSSRNSLDLAVGQPLQVIQNFDFSSMIYLYVIVTKVLQICYK